MDQNTYKNLLEESAGQLKASNLLAALAALRETARAMLHDDASARINSTERAYRAMLSYYRTGHTDAGRNEMFARFMREADGVWLTLFREYMLAFFNTAYTHVHSVLTEMRVEFADSDRAVWERWSVQTLFEALWTAPLFTEAQQKCLGDYLDDPRVPVERKQIAVSGLTLGAMDLFDPRKLLLLISLSRHSDLKVRARAMIGMVFVSLNLKERMDFYPEIARAVEVAFDSPEARRELVEVQMQMLLSLETKKISQSLRDEILPEMLRKTGGRMPASAEEITRLNAEMAELGLNPEWERDARRSDIGRKIHRLIEMQEKGADIFMSSFAMLKNRFAFFSPASNWFLPFTPDHPDLHIGGKRKEFVRMADRFAMICDSDKYSLALLVGQMPEEQFDALHAQCQAMMPDGKDIVAPEDTFTTVLRSALQDFYRFATLYRHNDYSLNPFAHSLLFVTTAPFRNVVGTGETLYQVATFAFDEKDYGVALPLIERLLEAEPTARLWQMAGYCHQCQGEYAEAVTAYERSGLFGDYSAWTVRQLAACLRASGRYEEALPYYEQMAADRPGEKSVLLRRAQCLEQTGRTDEALELLYQADYQEETPGRGTRALLAALFHASRFEQAQRIGARLIAAGPDPADRLLTAHAAWLGGDTAEAIARYKDYYSRISAAQRAAQNATEILFASERRFMLQNGKTQVDLQIMADAVTEMQE